MPPRHHLTSLALVSLALCSVVRVEVILSDDFEDAPTGVLAPDYLETHWQANVINGADNRGQT
ncbi:hypothetical protein [Coraliomargarita parva]|uniref:hypothetical protein n=1 Tax=Coraliomargarita parva TaxID=3014050 RepID=UPI0022B4997C|nr:hypothetical protein [Coraliomargarita parva]